jgi:uncharacterized protein YbjT (DUF2867 family)
MTILVTGATGNVGRLVVDELLERGATDIRALTARPAEAALPDGVEVVVGHLGRPDAVARAVAGVERMYLAPSPAHAEAVVAQARAAGVTRIVDLAGGEGGLWFEIEGKVAASGIECTHLEPGEFMYNAGEWAEQIRTTGQVRDAYPDVANAPIDLGDIAAVAAVTLLEDGHAGRRYELTGPESLTRAQRVAAIGAALGREVPFVEVSPEQAVAERAPTWGEEAARWYVDGLAQLREHPQAAVPTVEQVLGRPAVTFARWAEENVDTFR